MPRNNPSMRTTNQTTMQQQPLGRVCQHDCDIKNKQNVLFSTPPSRVPAEHSPGWRPVNSCQESEGILLLHQFFVGVLVAKFNSLSKFCKKRNQSFWWMPLQSRLGKKMKTWKSCNCYSLVQTDEGTMELQWGNVQKKRLQGDHNAMLFCKTLKAVLKLAHSMVAYNSNDQ